MFPLKSAPQPLRLATLLPIAALAAACGGPSADTGLLRVQTDWFAQPEHGGYYQAWAGGGYDAAGLEVEIIQGGPNALPLQSVARGRATFGFSRADDVIAAIDRGMPLVIVAATLQRDPQALMFHADDPAETWEDLDGRRVMAMPGSIWIDYLEHHFEVNLEIVSLDYGLGRFLADPELIQQCFISNQPFYARGEGVEVKTWLIAETGYDPYHALFAHRDFVRENPETVTRFLRASEQGWREYLEGDPSPADEIILRRNAAMSPEFIDYARQTMRRLNLVTGNPEDGESIGRLDRDRTENLLREMRAMGVIGDGLTVDDVMADLLHED